MKLNYERKNVWNEVNENEHTEIMEYGQRYMDFLDAGKTEREATDVIIKMAEEKGFISLDEALKAGKLERGMKIYLNNRNKSAVLMVLGKDLSEGMRIVGAHLDVPRLDVKPNPLYEEENLALLKTHYYGGVKKYQWTCIPLAIHGIIHTKSGEEVKVNIGEDAEDPVFYINDLLIHLSKDQMAKTLAEGITGEQLNVVVGHSSFGNDDEESKTKVKDNILKLLNNKYGIIEEDFQFAELEIVPSEKAKHVGFDKSMIAAHGHDDRVCSYAGLEAVLEVEDPEITCVGIFVDKEEIGSYGNTGMDSHFFENMVAELLSLENKNAMLAARKSLQNSKVLSGDVTAGMDPSFPEVLEKQNAARIGSGICISKYTGSRGKGGCNDANAEFLQEVREAFEAGDVTWQTGELGKIDQGGGGTIAFILARYGAEVVDCGTPMLSMHAPLELVSKADAYMTKKGYAAFYKA